MRRALLLALPLLLGGAPAADLTVSGTFLYVDREFTFDGGFTGVEPELPIGFARVSVLDAATGATLASGATDGDGDFALPVSGTGSLDLVVRCISIAPGPGGNGIRVTTPGGMPFSVSSPVFPAWDLDVDLDAGVTVAQPVQSGPNVGGPFDVLAQAVAAANYVFGLGETALPQEIEVFWPEPGTVSFATGNEVHLGSDDGFDDVVVLHEVGHVIHNLFSDSDSPGGPHSFTQSLQDPALSLGEGWASWFAGVVRRSQGVPDPGFYADMVGDGSTGPGSIQLVLDFETAAPFAAQVGGEASEAAVLGALWDLVDTAAEAGGTDDDPIDGSFLFPGGLAGDELIWSAFTGPTVLAAPALNVGDLWEGLFLDAGADHYPELAALFEAWQMRFFQDALEPNDVEGQGTPLTLGPQWSETRTLYRSDADPPVPAQGDEDVYLLFLAESDVVEIETRYPGGDPGGKTYADTTISVTSPSGFSTISAIGGGAGLNAKLSNFEAFATGTHRVTVKSGSGSRPYGSYELRARAVGSTLPALFSIDQDPVPAIQPGPPFNLILQGENLIPLIDFRVGGVPVTSFQAFEAAILFELPPNLPSLGTLEVQVTTPEGAASLPVTVTAPPGPIVNGNDGESVWVLGEDVVVTVGSDPGDLAFVLFSTVLQPTVVPGILSADIGGGLGGLFGLFSAPIGPGATASQTFPLSGPPAGLEVHLQAAIFEADTQAFPLTVSPVSTATLF